MLLQKQLYRHDPANGVYGDCARTALACMLDLPVELVPHFAAKYWNDPEMWCQAVQEYLVQHDLYSVVVHYDASPADTMRAFGACNPGMYYLLSGRSRGGTDHVVICLDDKIYWDPAQNDSGIVDRGSSGFCTIELFVPRRFVK